METSAKTNVNIDKAFYDMAKKILDKQPEKKPVTTSADSTIVPGGNDTHRTNNQMNCCWSNRK